MTFENINELGKHLELCLYGHEIKINIEILTCMTFNIIIEPSINL